MTTEAPEDPKPGEALLHLLPIPLRAGMNVESIVASVLPWTSPALLGVTGSNSDGEPLLIIGYEWPIPWARVTTSLTKREIEWLQLERFRTDHVFGTQTLPFVDAAPGADPPDFVVSAEAGWKGVECTSLTVSERREALGLFNRVRVALVARPRPQLLHLAGFMIYMWFGRPGALDRPFRKDDDRAVEEMIQALLDYRPDPERLRIQGDSMPAQAPDPGAVETNAGASFYAVPFAFAAPHTLMFALQGFEVGLSFATEHTPQSAWQEIGRLIAAHDKPGVDWIVVSAGAPNQHGQAFPSDEALARFAIDHPLPLPTPNHVKRVTLHSWGEGEAWDLLPHPERLFGPLYQGNAVAHLLLLPSEQKSGPSR